MTALDLSLVSDEDLNREYWRRVRANLPGKDLGGRPKNLKPCPKCGEQFGFRELRAHQPGCTPPQKFFIDRPKSTRKKIGDGHAEYVTAEGIRLAWSGSMPLPEVGDKITITMNSIGPARVMGYFMEGGYLGVMTKALRPPKWLREQRKEEASRTDMPQWWRDGIGCEFGTEIEPFTERKRRRA